MHFSVTIFDLTVLLGIAQGMIMTAMLYLTPSEDRSKTYLGCILLVLSLLSFKIVIHTLGLWELPWLRYFPLAIDTILPPLFYLYVLSITGKEKRKNLILYFLPTILFMAYAVVIYLITVTITNNTIKDHLAERYYFNQVKATEDWVAACSAFTFWLLGYRRILAYRQWLFETQSDSRLQELTWLRNIVLLSGALVLAFATVVLLEETQIAGEHHFVHLQVFYTYLAGLIYYLSIKGYQLYAVPKLGNDTIRKIEREQTASELFIQNDAAPNKEKEYINHEPIKRAIIQALEIEKLYLNPELGVKDLAQHINYPVNAVSAAINAGFQMNFRNLVNRYRIEEVKKRLTAPPSHLSLLGIALDCGFNSEASFYRIFRQQTGRSPGDHIQQLKNDQ